MFFMMKVHPDQADPKRNHSCMACRAYVQLPLDVEEIDASIDKQILKTPNDLLFHLADLEIRIKTNIGTTKKYRRDIFLEYCTESFKSKFL